MATASQLLTECENAISACLKAQDYTVAGRQKRMAELRELRILRQELKDEVANASDGGGSMATLGQVVEPS